MIRAVFTPQNDNFVFSIPDDYIGKKLEVIIFPIEEGQSDFLPSPKASFNAISIDTRQYKFDREEANAR